MKFFKFITTVLACAMAVSLTSCVYVTKVKEGDITAKVESLDTVASETVAETTVQETIATSATDASSALPLPTEYSDILEVYKTGIESKWMPEQYENAGISYTAHYLTDISEIGYALFDLDDNGTKELIISTSGNQIMNVFTVSGGKLVSLLSCTERTHFYLFEDGFIISSGAYSAFSGDYVVYQLKEDNIAPLQYFVYEFEGDNEKPLFYFSTKTKDTESMSPISSESAYEMLAGYVPLEITFDSLKQEE